MVCTIANEHYLDLSVPKTHLHFKSSIDPSLLIARAAEAELDFAYRRKNILSVRGADVSEVQVTLYNVPVMLFTFVGFFIVQDSSQVLKVSPKRQTKLGSQIIREWNGRTYTVQVTDKGYVMAGITYGSLSAAAKAITGSHWSGPRFFGVEA